MLKGILLWAVGNTGLTGNICLVFGLSESSFLLSKPHHPVHSEDCLCTCKCLSYTVYKGAIFIPGPPWYQQKVINSGYVFNRNLLGNSEVISPVLQEIQKQVHRARLNGLSPFHKQTESSFMLTLLHHSLPSMHGPVWRGRPWEFTNFSN